MICPECKKKMRFIKRVWKFLETIWHCDECNITIARFEEE